MIRVNHLKRDYYFKEKEPGFKGSLRYLFKPKKVTKTAVKDFSFHIKKGEIVGLIGPNGAGKTTLIKMLTGIIPPSEGTIDIMGFVPSELKDDFRKKYAVIMGQKSQLWWDLPALDSFQLNKEIYQIPDAQYEKNLKELVDIFEVEAFLQKQVRQLSLGQRMKMEIIASLLHDPEVIFLDEPTIGLDGVAQKQIRKFLKKVNEERHTTIILTSHYMEDIKSLCERIIVINDGEKVYEGTYQDLVNKVSPYKIVEVVFEIAVEVLIELPVEYMEKNPYKIKMKVDKSKVNEVVGQLFNHYAIEDLAIEEEDITDVVEKIYRDI
ncbi:MAG: ATP-binding cassette domain-containing protein [Vallitaleaceae bacterium]|jgi:ABC-2 type transport system ATP-binding protein|nr:ATP-binding cassette domain-containing protein [Vallitaleaceae bacterium]